MQLEDEKFGNLNINIIKFLKNQMYIKRLFNEKKAKKTFKIKEI